MDKICKYISFSEVFKFDRKVSYISQLEFFRNRALIDNSTCSTEVENHRQSRKKSPQ